ncbi:hypothetical protein [Methanomethylovorans sp.]|uniref:hypothetical protein n=1 Tax=Methanomethylovorans sp. TaxID=2758717 RepID=UPI00351C7F83
MQNKIVIDINDGKTELVIDDSVVKEWIDTYKEYSPMLRPNRKTVAEIVEYIILNYPAEEDKSEKCKSVVVNNITMNEPFAKRIPYGNDLDPIVFFIKNEGRANDLYQKQEGIYKNVPIMIGMESGTGFVYVEGSKELSDEITAFQGLDSDELTNFYLVANYVRCLKKYNRLNEVLNHTKHNEL